MSLCAAFDGTFRHHLRSYVLGMQDAVNLGWKLAAELHGWAPPELLDYDQLFGTCEHLSPIKDVALAGQVGIDRELRNGALLPNPWVS
jgi:hypothetical protein